MHLDIKQGCFGFLDFGVDVTSTLTHRHMRCDNHFPRCGEQNKTINHTIF